MGQCWRGWAYLFITPAPPVGVRFRGVRVVVVAERAKAGLAVPVERFAPLVARVVLDLRRGEEEGVFGIRWEVRPA